MTIYTYGNDRWHVVLIAVNNGGMHICVCDRCGDPKREMNFRQAKLSCEHDKGEGNGAFSPMLA